GCAAGPAATPCTPLPQRSWVLTPVSTTSGACTLYSPPFFSFLTIRRPRRPTLFPYTTLFRSHHSHGRARGRSRDVQGVPRQAGQDRKSTRLNSSHVKNSYAVFWLKKNTTGRPPHAMHRAMTGDPFLPNDGGRRGGAHRAVRTA